MDLDEFIRNDYLTQEEISKKSEETHKEEILNNAQKSLKTTQISLAITALALISTVILQIIFSSNQQEIKIINPESFKDTIKVKMLDNQGIVKDSIDLK